MAGYDIGLKLGIDGEAEFRKNIQAVADQTKTLGTEMGAVTAQFAKNANSQQALSAKTAVLNKQIAAQKEKLALQQDMLARSTEKFGANAKETQSWQQAVNRSTAELYKMQNALDSTNGGLDGVKERLNSFASSMKNGLAAAAKVSAAALTAASGAVAALTKSAVENYSEYEQLVGGVETLFEQSSGTVMDYAEKAYQTAGLSANEYMDTVTSFSASLLQALGGDTEAAAEKADLAIIDMADNANKMGTSIDSIQNAYQGFAKQNYTMLDNLKLGYGGTKEEMQRLLEDAQKLSGQKYDISSFADIVDAIHVVQTEMGITGTTAKEASTTIQGSVSSMKAAWQNLMTGLGNENADFGVLIENLVGSVKTAADNLVPRIVQILSGMGSVVEQLAPILAAELPSLISELLPPVISAGAQLLAALATGIISALPELIESLPEIGSSIIDALTGSLPALQTAGGELIGILGTGIVNGIPALVANLPTVVAAIFNFLAAKGPRFTEVAFDFIGNLAFGLVEAIPEMVKKLPEIISAIVSFLKSELPVFVKKGGEMISKLAVGMIGAIPELLVSIPEVILSIVQTLEDGYESLKETGKYLLEGLWDGIADKVEWLKSQVSGVVETIKGWFTGKRGFDIHSPSKVFMTIGEYLMEGLAIGMENSKGNVMQTAEDIASEVTDRFRSITSALDTRSDISDLQYQLWEMTGGKNATETEKYEKKLEMLTDQEAAQAGVVEAAQAAYEAMADQYGTTSTEALDYLKTLLQEKLAYEKLEASIQDVLDKQRELNLSAGVRSSFADVAGTMQRSSVEAASDAAQSAAGRTTYGVNSQGVFSATITMKTEDGRNMGSWMTRFVNEENAANPPVRSDVL